jgi:hypothetical protein
MKSKLINTILSVLVLGTLIGGCGKSNSKNTAIAPIPVGPIIPIPWINPTVVPTLDELRARVALGAAGFRYVYADQPQTVRFGRTVVNDWYFLSWWTSSSNYFATTFNESGSIWSTTLPYSDPLYYDRTGVQELLLDTVLNPQYGYEIQVGSFFSNFGYTTSPTNDMNYYRILHKDYYGRTIAIYSLSFAIPMEANPFYAKVTGTSIFGDDQKTVTVFLSDLFSGPSGQFYNGQIYTNGSFFQAYFSAYISF